VGPHLLCTDSWRKPLNLGVRVIPEVPTFSVDKGFRYLVPEDVKKVQVGSVVRVPLGGRRVRGYVVSIENEPTGDRKLKEIVSVSSDVPVFHEKLLETLRWIAAYYVAPLGSVLPRAAPPNLPKLKRSVEVAEDIDCDSSFLSGDNQMLMSEERIRQTYLVTSRADIKRIGRMAADVCRSGGNTLIVMPTVHEAKEMVKKLQPTFGSKVLEAHSGLSPRSVTAVWLEAAICPGRIVVGTREIALWPLRQLSLAVVVEEGRRAMKSPQTPTWHVREVLNRRSKIERAKLVLMGSVPTLETFSNGFAIRESVGRIWPLVEVVDRTEDPPGSGFVTNRTRQALKITMSRHGRAFVLVNRRGYAPAFGCIACRTVRRCPFCGAASGHEKMCQRCHTELNACAQCGGNRFEPFGAGVGRIVDELRGVLGPVVGIADEYESSVIVGTERDLPGMARMELVVAVDADAAILAPHYRAPEDALRLLARLTAMVHPGSGNRAIIQTGMPSHPVMAALRNGNPMDFLEAELATRVAASFPPSGDLIAIEVRGDVGGTDQELRETVFDEIRGPAVGDLGTRWLIQGVDLSKSKVELKKLTQRWRDRGLRVRIDVDPIDL